MGLGTVKKKDASSQFRRRTTLTSTKAKTFARATELRALGTAAFRAGNPSRARQHFTRALLLFRETLGDRHADTLGTLSDLGAVCAALGDHAASREAHQAALAGRRATLGDTHPETAASLHNLGAALRALGDLAAAETCHMQAAAIWRAALGDAHPLVAKALASLAGLALARDDSAAAIHFAQQALDIRMRTRPPGDPVIAAALDDLATAQAHAGDAGAAERSWNAAIGMLRARGGRPVALLHLKAGAAQRRHGNLDAAATHFAAALAADPALTAARHNLATTLLRLGRAEDAKPHRDRALREKSLFVQHANAAAPSVLIMSLADDGNIPLEHLLPERDYTRIWWFIDHAAPDTETDLPRHDIVLNAIGDADMAADVDRRAAAFIAASGKPALNDPAQVAKTRRDRLSDLLAGIAGIATPATQRFEGTLKPASAPSAAGDTRPVLLRPAGSHGGAGLVRVEAWAALQAQALPAARAWYASPLHDCRSADGYFRKYRAIFIDRRPFPYHLAISPDWLVHYYTSDMAGHDWKLQEEARFLADPEAVLGRTAYAALAETGRRLDLDYCGVDFTLMPDRTILVFEANPTMLVHPERDDSALAFKNPAVARITAAMRDMISCRIKAG